MFRFLIGALVVLGVVASSVQSQTPTLTDYPSATASAFPPHPSVQSDRDWTVFRLANAEAKELVNVIQNLLKSERAERPMPPSPYHQPPKAPLAILAEPVTNSLLISAPPDATKKIETLIQHLDVAPPMVRIEMLVVELANPSPEAAKSSDRAPSTVEQLAGELGLAEPGASAAAKDVAARIGELEKSGRVRVVRRPQLMTLSNKSAQLVIGQKKPYIASSSKMQFGTSNNISYMDVGLTLTVTPRAGADNVVTAEVQLTESRMGDTEDGVPVLVTDKETVRSPAILSLNVQSVVRLHDGRTAVLGGLATHGATDQKEQLILITASVVRD